MLYISPKPVSLKKLQRQHKAYMRKVIKFDIEMQKRAKNTKLIVGGVYF